MEHMSAHDSTGAHSSSARACNLSTAALLAGQGYRIMPSFGQEWGGQGRCTPPSLLPWPLGTVRLDDLPIRGGPIGCPSVADAAEGGHAPHSARPADGQLILAGPRQLQGLRLGPRI